MQTLGFTFEMRLVSIQSPIALLFVLSGTAALIYEVVWLHLLRLTLGVSAYSLGVVLAVFMGGLALGNLLYARFVSARHHPLKVYAVLEWGIGGWGLVMPVFLTWATDIYLAMAGEPSRSLLVRVIVAAILLLPPTTFMGATLPAIARWVRRDKVGAAQLGWFYAANIAGAVCGSLLAGLVLMQFFDARIASFTAAAINGLAGIMAWGISLRHDIAPESIQETTKLSPCSQIRTPEFAWPAVVLFCSGLTALAAEVIWTRLLTLSLGPTVYTFALVLAVFLSGLGFGSGIGSALLSRFAHPLAGLGICQLALVVTIPIASSSFADQGLRPESFWMLSFATHWPATIRDLVRCAFTVLPSAVLWGASFPFAVATVLPQKADQAATVGSLTAANTLGAIVGALGTTFVVIPGWGSLVSQQLLVMIAAFAAGCCLVGFVTSNKRSLSRAKLSAVTIVIVMIAVLGTCFTQAPSPAIFAYGREAAQRRRDAPMLVVREGVHTPIVVTYWPQHNRTKALHLAGKLEASDDKIDLRLERLLGHLPQFLCKNPESVLVVGLGAGITAGTFLMDERTKGLIVCELEPALPPITAKHFGHVNNDVLNDPRTQLVIDDGRHYLQAAGRQFDVISVDPIHPWVRGASSLYSEEFIAQCLAHLRPGGIISYWVPMHSMTIESVKSEVATFSKVVPHAMLWHTGGTMLQRHMLILGSNEPFRLDLQEMDRLITPRGRIESSIREMQFDSADDVLTLYLADKANLREWLADAQLNSDMSMRLEYLAGSAAYTNEREEIFGQIVQFRRWPMDLFHGEESRLRWIRENLGKFDEVK